MEKNEPSLVPEWLRAPNGGATGGSHTSKARSPSNADRDLPYGASVGCNGLGNEKDNYLQSRDYINFSRNRSDRDHRRETGYHENERPVKVANGYRHDYDNKFRKAEKNDGRNWWKLKYATIPKDLTTRNSLQGNQLDGGSLTRSFDRVVIPRTSFERDFPLLVPSQRQEDKYRASSPHLDSSSLPIVPSIINNDVLDYSLLPSATGSFSMKLPAQRSAPPSMLSGSGAAGTSLNMAETLAKAPSRPHSAPQLVAEAQKLEELAIRQSKQLIPLTPSAPKTSIIYLAEKSKLKPRMGDLGVSFKSVIQPSLPVNHSHGVPKPDSSKASQGGNFQVLKREKNGVISAVKDVSNSSACSTSGLLGSAPFAMASIKHSVHQNMKADGKVGPASVFSGNPAEQKAALRAKDRHRFFNSIRKQTSANVSISPQSLVSSPKAPEKKDR